LPGYTAFQELRNGIDLQIETQMQVEFSGQIKQKQGTLGGSPLACSVHPTE
jgi:hypothetical protein